MNRRRLPNSGRRAFTLVEAIVTIVILAALAVSTSGLIFDALTVYRDMSLHAQLQQEASSALMRICDEVRKIPLDPAAATPSPLISSVTASSLAWNSNWTLTFSASKLQLVESGGTAATLLDGVTAFTIACFDESNNALSASLSGSACATVRRIQFTLTVQRQGISESIRSRVFLRSTMAGGSA
jgi:prepilin-type N-terminal cleavage/methylation domain-containing protein